MGCVEALITAATYTYYFPDCFWRTYEFSAFGLTGSCPLASTTVLKSIHFFTVMLQPRIIDSKSAGLSKEVCLSATAWLRLMLTKVPSEVPTLPTHPGTAQRLPPQGMLEQPV